MVAAEGLRVCEPHSVASDLLEQATMKTANDQATPVLALRPREAAEALGISPRLLFTWTKDGVIPAVKVGRTVLYSTIELQAWLSRQAEANVA